MNAGSFMMADGLLFCNMLTAEEAVCVKVRTLCTWQLSVFSAHLCCEPSAAVREKKSPNKF